VPFTSDVWKIQDSRQIKNTEISQKASNAKHRKQNCRGSVAVYDTLPGNKRGGLAPEPTWGQLVLN